MYHLNLQSAEGTLGQYNTSGHTIWYDHRKKEYLNWRPLKAWQCTASLCSTCDVSLSVGGTLNLGLNPTIRNKVRSTF